MEFVSLNSRLESHKEAEERTTLENMLEAFSTDAFDCPEIGNGSEMSDGFTALKQTHLTALNPVTYFRAVICVCSKKASSMI